MRKVVSEAFLRDAIFAKMAAAIMPESSGTFWARPVRKKRIGDGPNWRHEFNPAAVPEGYVHAWERIRHEFEDAFDLEDE